MSTNSSVNFDLPTPKITMSRELYTKIMWWVAKATPSECSGLGKTVIEGDTIKIVDAWMVKQKNSSATTDMDEDAIGQLMYEKRDVPGIMNFWWHSHANMDVFWSGTDRQQIAKIANNGMCVAIVFNNAKKARACIAVNSPIPMHIDDVRVVVEDNYLTDQWDKEFDDAIVKRSYHSRGESFLSRYYDGYGEHMSWTRDNDSGLFGQRHESTALTHRPIGLLAGEPEDPARERQKRLDQIDKDLTVLEEFMSKAIGTRPGTVPIEVKRILGLAHVVIDQPHEEFEISHGRKADFYTLAWDKSVELDEELSILRGTGLRTATTTDTKVVTQ